jgi:hypothetical protein
MEEKLFRGIAALMIVFHGAVEWTCSPRYSDIEFVHPGVLNGFIPNFLMALSPFVLILGAVGMIHYWFPKRW